MRLGAGAHLPSAAVASNLTAALWSCTCCSRGSGTNVIENTDRSWLSHELRIDARLHQSKALAIGFNAFERTVSRESDITLRRRQATCLLVTVLPLLLGNLQTQLQYRRSGGIASPCSQGFDKVSVHIVPPKRHTKHESFTVPIRIAYPILLSVSFH